MKSQISTNYLKRLRKALPTGGVNEIAVRVGISSGAVSKVFSGENENTKVVETAIILIEEEKAKAKALEQRIDDVLA